MRDKVTTRRATMKDYDAICRLTEQVDALHVELVPDVFRRHTGPARPRSTVADWINERDSDYLLAEVDGEVVGFLNIRTAAHPDVPVFHPHEYALIENLVIDEGRRRHGIGTALLEEAIGWTRAHGLGFIQLNVWAANVPAVEFYHKHGFRTLSSRMELTLEE